MTSEKLEQLKKKCDELGLVVVPAGKKLSKKDCIRTLQEYHSPSSEMKYEQITPMKCATEDDLKPEEIKELWREGKPYRWYLQEKINGVRIILHFRKGIGVFAQTRSISKKTYRYNDVSDRLVFHDFIPDFEAVLDTEAVVNGCVDTTKYTRGGTKMNSNLHSTIAILHLDPDPSRELQINENRYLIFCVFDCLKFDDKDLRGEIMPIRLSYMCDVMAKLKALGLDEYFTFVPAHHDSKKRRFKRIIQRGGEGAIMKDMEATYSSSGNKSKGWIKVKKRIEYDAFVTGFKRGEKGSAWENMVGALEFSVYLVRNGNIQRLNELHTIAVCSSMTLEERREMTIYDAEKDEVSLKPEYYGRVAEVSGQELSPRVNRLTHAVIERWREGVDGKEQNECYMEV